MGSSAPGRRGALAGLVVLASLWGCLAPYFGDEDGDGDGVRYLDDCDDRDPFVAPGAEEICDGKDDDCDGILPVDEVDDDGDGDLPCAGDEGACDQDPTLGPTDSDGDGVSTCAGDCNDLHPGIFPGAGEDPADGLDGDCDGLLDPSETDGDGDGYAEHEGDCDDADPEVSPGAPERACDGVDNDCNGLLDPNEIDNDGDGFSECAGDCDDAASAISPAASESTCNGVDDDCDGRLSAEETDADGDGWTAGCPSRNPDHASNDCDDTEPLAYPREADADRLEVCGDGVNDDCDLPLTGGDTTTFAEILLMHDWDSGGSEDYGPDMMDFVDVLDTAGSTAGVFRLTTDAAGAEGRVFGRAPALFDADGVAFRADLGATVPPGSRGFAVVLTPADPFLDDPGAWDDDAAEWLGQDTGAGAEGLGYAGLGEIVPGQRTLAVAFRSGGPTGLDPSDTVSLEDGGPDRILAVADLGAVDIDSDLPTVYSLTFRHYAAAGTVTVTGSASRGAAVATFTLGTAAEPVDDVGFASVAWYLGVTASDSVAGGGFVPRLGHVAIQCD